MDWSKIRIGTIATVFSLSSIGSASAAVVAGILDGHIASIDELGTFPVASTFFIGESYSIQFTYNTAGAVVNNDGSNLKDYFIPLTMTVSIGNQQWAGQNGLITTIINPGNDASVQLNAHNFYGSSFPTFPDKQSDYSGIAIVIYDYQDNHPAIPLMLSNLDVPIPGINWTYPPDDVDQFSTLFSFGGDGTTQADHWYVDAQIDSSSISVVPEPSTIWIFIGALNMLGYMGSRRSNCGAVNMRGWFREGI